MSLKEFLTLVFLLTYTLFSWSQEQSIYIKQSSNHYLFTYQNESYLINNDSIFCLSSPIKHPSKLHGMDLKEFQFVSNDSIGYMKNASTGVVYSFDGKNFKRLDHSFPYNTQFKSFSFIHNKTIMDFGGYGLHTFKNIITYFNFDKKETELLKQKSTTDKSPLPRDRMAAQYSNGELFIGPGQGYMPETNYPFDFPGIIKDYWKFSFEDLSWTKLGDGELTFNEGMFSFIYDFNNTSLLLSDLGIFEIDIKNNLLTHYKEANLDIVRTLNANRKLYYITYNKKLDGFYMIINKADGAAETIFSKREDFLGSTKIVTELYDPHPNKTYTIGGIIILMMSLIGFYLYKRNKKSTAQKLKPKLNSIRDEIKIEDFRILNILINDYPEYTNYSDLMDVFPEHNSYENKKKKIKLSLVLLEDYLNEKCKLNKPVFEFRKNLEDRREKQLRIK